MVFRCHGNDVQDALLEHNAFHRPVQNSRTTVLSPSNSWSGFRFGNAEKAPFRDFKNGMPRVSHRAGQNIRELALKRRTKSVLSFMTAIFVLVFPFILLKIFQDFLNSLSSISSSQPQASLNLPFMFYVLFGLVSLGCVANGVYLWKRANHADQGAQGEEAIGLLVSELEQEGWTVEYGMRLGNRLGDADIVCLSPQKKAYVIDVKSHRGTITTDGKQLYRRMGKATYSFEKDFLAQVKQQALQVKKQKGLSFVTPIVAFSMARVSITGKTQKVYVVESARLIQLLRHLG